MTRSTIYLDTGKVREGKTRYRTSGAVPRADYIEIYPGDTLATITTRAYGANTPENRERIRGANASLEGLIRVPR
jgi:hypothetical protein